MPFPTTSNTIQRTCNPPQHVLQCECTLIWKRELSKLLLTPVSCDISQYDFGQVIPDNTFLHLWAEPRGLLFPIINSDVSDRDLAAYMKDWKQHTTHQKYQVDNHHIIFNHSVTPWQTHSLSLLRYNSELLPKYSRLSASHTHTTITYTTLLSTVVSPSLPKLTAVLAQGQQRICVAPKHIAQRETVDIWTSCCVPQILCTPTLPKLSRMFNQFSLLAVKTRVLLLLQKNHNQNISWAHKYEPPFRDTFIFPNTDNP
jgi:hypothetical protein